MSSSDNSLFKGQQFRPMVGPAEGGGEGGSKKSQFKFPVTGRQSAIPTPPPVTGGHPLPQFNLPIAREQDTSMFQFPDIEEQGNSEPGLPVTSSHIPMFRLPVIDERSTSTSGSNHLLTTGPSVPMLRLPVIGERGNAMPSPAAPMTGTVPMMPPAPGLHVSTSAFQVPTVSGVQSMPSLPSLPSAQPYSQPYRSVPTPVRERLDTPPYLPPTTGKRDTATGRRPVTPPPVPVNPRLDKNMPFIAIIINIVLVVLVVGLTQNQIFTSPNGAVDNLLAPNGVHTPLKRSLNDITNNHEISPFVFGTNMALFHDNDEEIINSAATRQMLKDIGVRVIRMPMRTTLKDSTTLAAAQAIKDIGAAPLAVIHGPEFKEGSILQANEHALQLLTQIFGKQPIYCEFGNESDLNGIKVEQYIQVWNQVIPRLKQEFPTAHFIGPDNYQFTRRYLKTFLQHAQPLPDGVSWHEYTCSVHWTAAFCLSLLDTWSVHFSQARAAMREAIGKELPIWVSEWNYVSDQEVVNGQPLNDGKYNNTSFMTAWTSKAMQNLLENRIYASMQYYATDAPMPLIAGDHLGIEGQIFQQQYKKVMVDGQTPPMRSPQPPTPKPTMIPGQSFSFENGSTAGWMTVGAGVTQPVVSTDRAFDGTHSLLIHLTNASEDSFPYLAINADQVTTPPKAGQMISGYLFVANKAALVNAKIFVAGTSYSWHFAGDLTMNSGTWSRVWYSLPMNFTGKVTQIGIQLYTSTPGVATDVYFDAFNWS